MVAPRTNQEETKQNIFSGHWIATGQFWGKFTLHPPFDLQIFSRVLPPEVFKKLPGCYPVARLMKNKNQNTFSFVFSSFFICFLFSWDSCNGRISKSILRRSPAVPKITFVDFLCFSPWTARGKTHKFQAKSKSNPGNSWTILEIP